MRIFLCGLLCLFLPSAHADVAQRVTIENAFARAAIQQQRNSAAFMTIHNPGDSAHIAYAKSPVANIVELHTHTNDNGVMRMRKIKRIDLPAAGTVVLKPGGLHVMLLGLTRDMKNGDQIPVTLGYSDGSETLLTIPVRMMKVQHTSEKQDHRMEGEQPAMMRH